MAPSTNAEIVWESFWLLANSICHLLESQQPDLVVVVYKSGSVVWRAVEILWQATRPEPLPATIGVNIGRRQTEVYEDEVASFGHVEWGDEWGAGVSDIGRLAAWAADHPILRPALAARLAAQGIADPRRILVVDDVVSGGATAFLTMGLLWGAAPQAGIDFLAGLPGFWRETLGRAWLSEAHPGLLDVLDRECADSDWPWRHLVSGLMDRADDPLGCQPLSAGHPVVKELERWLPAAEWLRFPVWVQSSLEAASQRRLAATQLPPQDMAAACYRLRPPMHLHWTPQHRMWGAGWRESNLTVEGLAALAGLEPPVAAMLLAEMVAGGDFCVGEQEGQPCYSLRYR